MSEAQNKGAAQIANEQQQQQGQPIYTIQQPSAGPYAAVGAYPPYYPYPPPPTDANGHPTDPNAANGAPPGAYMMAFPPPPPGMIYAYPTAQGYPGLPFGPGMPLPAALVRPKRKQVKMACTNCAAACKRCDEGRPCERCCKYGIADTCQDGVRKERKKGIKRGPYKRKGKVSPEAAYEGFPQEQTPAEGFYPSYFYPPAGFVPIGPDGQPLQGDVTGVAGAQQAMAHPQYYPLHPAAYPPFAAYPHTAGAYPTVMAPGHMAMAQAGPSVTEAVPPGNGANSVVNAGNGNGADVAKAGSGAHAKDDTASDVVNTEGHSNGAPGGRGRRRGKAAATGGPAANGGSGGTRDDHGASSAGAPASKKGKKSAIHDSEGGGGGSLAAMAHAQGSNLG